MKAKNRKRTVRRSCILILLLLLLGSWVLTSCATYKAQKNLQDIQTDELAGDLRKVVDQLSVTIKERNVYHPAELEAAAQYITDQFAALKYRNASTFAVPVDPVDYAFQGAVPATNANNLVFAKPGGTKSNEVIIIGAHYDTMPFSDDWKGVDRSKFRPRKTGTPGANDNASGIAALLGIARILSDAPQLKKTVRFVAFANEEPPFFQHKESMGSSVYAAHCKDKGESISAMISLDVLGVYTRTDANTKRGGCFKRSMLSAAGLTEDPTYVAFLSNWQGCSGFTARKWARVFANHSAVTVKTLSVPFISGEIFAWSDDWSFTQQGYPAFCVTDGAMYRSDRYHEDWDTPDRITPVDYQRFAAVVQALATTIGTLANE